MTVQDVSPVVSVSKSDLAASPIQKLKLAGLILLILSISGNAYLWHRWQQDQAVYQAKAQSIIDLQMSQVQTKELQKLKTTVDQSIASFEALNKAIDDYRREIETMKIEIKRLQESRAAYEAFVQKQLQAYQEQQNRKMQDQKRNEVNW